MANHNVRKVKGKNYANHEAHKNVNRGSGSTKSRKYGSKAKYHLKRAAKQGIKSTAYAAMAQDDNLDQINQARFKYHQARRYGKYSYNTAKYTYKGGKAVAKTGYKVGKKTAKAGYKAGKQTANVSYKASKQAAKVSARVSARIAQFTAKVMAKTGAAIGKVVGFLATNPYLWAAVGIIAFILLIVIIVASIFSGNVVQQDQFTLNQSWVQIAKTDSDKSKGDTEYYTDIDSILLYMNYRYGGEWEPDANWNDGTGGAISGFLGFNHYSDALNDIWKEMNKDPDDIKTITYLYSPDGPKKWMHLNKDERDDYKEIQEAQKESGKYPDMAELVSPFVPKEDPKKPKNNDSEDKKETITISKRYGYTDDKFDPVATIDAKQNAKLYAVMDGTIEITKKDLLGKDTDTQNVIIKTKDAEFIYYNVDGIRVKNKQKVEEGDEIGKVKSEDGLNVAYIKQYETAKKGEKVSIKNSMKDYVVTRNDDKESWMLMNPGFYWQFVTYSQSTASSSSGSSTGSKTTLTAQQVAQKAGISVERAKDVIALFDHLVGKEGSTLQGASAVLAIAERESGFDPKAVNPGGGVAGYFQWSGWSNTVNGDRWANAPSRTLDSKVELELLHRELSTSHKHVKKYLSSAKDSGAAALYFSEQYEGVALSDGQTKADKLQSDAKKWEGTFKGTLKQGSSSGSKQGSGPGGTKASSWEFPAEYKDKLKNGMPGAEAVTGYPGNIYPPGQCTFYAKNRIHEIWNIDVDNFLGNGQDWVNSLTSRYGWRATGKPEVGAVCSTAGGFDDTYPESGHVSIVEAVNDDGSFLVSELNYAGNQTQVHWRVTNNASYYSFAMPPGH
ncbi:phage tail tip lysozyme [Streptococcus sobrinus]|uniref:phage tail tip lysozyme n=2 Tax=Streptococcus sobrinus TaxID=1310 RepID=UPI0002D83B3F|nr:phage tail tip lysozyme [Streptococcus sobrinus]